MAIYDKDKLVQNPPYPTKITPSYADLRLFEMGAALEVKVDEGGGGSVSLNCTTITLTSGGWSNNTQSVSVEGITETSVVFVSPAVQDADAYGTAGIKATEQATNSLTFSCTNTPNDDIYVTVVYTETSSTNSEE